MADRPVCPVCGKPRGSSRDQPFCSRRCAEVDLGRWLAEAYRLPVDDAEDEASQRQDQG